MSPNHEPLSPEERALADRLARLGPHDGPSPALDAKILAAAHAAVAPPRRRRRWLALSAIPGGLVTGVGMAAALAVVVGVVWQLRPAGPIPAPREEGADMGYVSAEIIERAKRAPVAPPPPPAEAPAPMKALRAPPRPPAAAARRQQAEPAVAMTQPTAHDHALDEAVTAAAPPAEQAATPEEARNFASYAAPAAPPPPAADAYMETRAIAQTARQEAAADAKEREASSAKMAAPARERAAASQSQAQPQLDRVEPTGSRVKSEGSLISAAPLSQMPVSADAELEAKVWLERIRERRDAGDLDGARESLKRFREIHPRVRLPRDLREFATSATR